MSVIGSIMSFPYMVLFYVSWIAASLVRPFLTVSLACVLYNPAAALRKGQIFVSALTYLVFCNDKSWKKPSYDSASFFKGLESTDPKVQTKTVIFVRHGESAWNETFNKGDRPVTQFALYFIPNLIKAIAMEWYFWASGHAEESWFYDSPLSEKGIRQAETIRTYLKTNVAYVKPREADMIRLMLGETTEKDKILMNITSSSQVVSSNLRRAIATIGIGLQDRFRRKGSTKDTDSILVLPALQEISRNPDALSITPPKGVVVPAWTDPKVLQDIYKYHVDTRFHTGNKPVDSNGLKRMQEFCRIAYEEIHKDNIIAVGHSLWFRSFFRTFLPSTVEHVAKQKKLINGGIVGFELQRVKVESGPNKGYHYMIDPTSIIVLHGGF